MIVVIPSSRAIRLDYLTPLIDAGARFIIVDDSEGSIHIDHPQFEVYNWSHRRQMLGQLESAIPRRNGACRDFGFYVAWMTSDDDEIIVALDDDCLVEQPDFAKQVEKVLSADPRPTAVCAGKHLNVLELYSNVSDRNIFPRGFPYSERVDPKRAQFVGQVAEEVIFNLGLWQGIFDVNAIDKIYLPTYSFDDAQLFHDNVVIPAGCLISVCSMNMHFRRSVLPAVYQLPMHVEVMPKWVIDRYGDIWGGFILKTLMDIRGDRMSFGGPMIRHLKEGSYQRNTWQEHLCHLVNDEFIALLDRAGEEIRPASYLDMMANLREEFARHRGQSSSILQPYLVHLDGALAAWVESLSQCSVTTLAAA